MGTWGAVPLGHGGGQSCRGRFQSVSPVDEEAGVFIYRFICHWLRAAFWVIPSTSRPLSAGCRSHRESQVWSLGQQPGLEPCIVGEGQPLLTCLPSPHPLSSTQQRVPSFGNISQARSFLCSKPSSGFPFLFGVKTKLLAMTNRALIIRPTPAFLSDFPSYFTPLAPSSAITPASCCSSNTPAMLLPQGLRTACSPSLECPPTPNSTGLDQSLTSFRSLIRSHLCGEAFLAHSIYYPASLPASPFPGPASYFMCLFLLCFCFLALLSV